MLVAKNTQSREIVDFMTFFNIIEKAIWLQNRLAESVFCSEAVT